jgi:2-C-methyl-D-erythritol 2,4-cyclodiphosphate synthase
MLDIREKGYDLGNADITVIAQAPKLRPYIDTMCERVAEIVGVSRSQISIKATTTEGLGPMGRGEGVAVHAVVILQTSEMATA